MATCPDPRFIDGNEAVDLARKALQLDPMSNIVPNTLGVALYRKGEWKDAIDFLAKSTELRAGGDSFDWFFLAMAHWQLDQKTEALEWYEKAVQWMDKSPENEELLRFRNEATKLLNIVSKSESGESVTPKGN